MYRMDRQQSGQMNWPAAMVLSVFFICLTVVLVVIFS
jgi:ABC-type spermidine/putrescine transport system permease subunit I